MTTPVAARRKNGSAPLASDAAAATRARTLGRGGAAAAAAAGIPFGRGGATAAAAATAVGIPFGRGGGSTTPTHFVSRGVGLAPPPRSRGRGGGSAASPTAPFSIDGCIGGGFPSSSTSMEGFPFPPESSPSLFESAGGDPSSPASWDKEVRPSGGFMSYFTNEPHNSHLVGAMKKRRNELV